MDCFYELRVPGINFEVGLCIIRVSVNCIQVPYTSKQKTKNQFCLYDINKCYTIKKIMVSSYSKVVKKCISLCRSTGL